MSEPKFYRRKIRPQKRIDSFNDIRIPSDLIDEARRRRIELIRREIITERSSRLPQWKSVMIRFKLFLTRLWTKMRKQ